jgi:hypothetical protein
MTLPSINFLASLIQITPASPKSRDVSFLFSLNPFFLQIFVKYHTETYISCYYTTAIFSFIDPQRSLVHIRA